MNVLIIEPTASGHHANYLRWIALALADAGHAVTLATAAATLAHPVIEDIQRKVPGFSALPMKEGLQMGAGRLYLVAKELSDWVAYHRAWRQAGRRRAVDFVVLPFLDSCVHAMSLLGSPFGQTRWCGISMRPSFHYHGLGIASEAGAKDALDRLLFLRLLRRTRYGTVLSIDESLVDYVHSSDGRAARNLRYLPDPIDSTAPRGSSPRLKLPGTEDGSFVVLIYGSITDRKGLDVVLDALVDDRTSRDVHLLIAGRQEPDAVSMLKARPSAVTLRQQGRLHEWNRFLNEADETLAFTYADLSWLGYRGHLGMSGVLLLSAFHAVPVLTGPQGLLARMTAHYGVGAVLEELSASDAATAIEQFRASAAGAGNLDWADRCRELATRHSLQAARAVLLEMLSKKGLSNEC